MSYDAILKLLQRLHRMRHKPDLHSFKAKIKDGVVFVEAQWDGFSVDFFTYDDAGNETREHWVGSTAKTARELERRGLDLDSVET